MNIDFKLKTLKNFIKTEQLILILSLGYLGLLFAGKTDFLIWILITIALVSANIAHISFRKLQEEKNDKSKNPRLKDLLVPEGGWKNLTIWPYGLISSIILIFSSFMINEICYYLSIISVILFISYPMIRKFSSLPSYNFGIFGALCPISGFIAGNNRIELIPFVLGASIVFWTVGIEICQTIFNMQNNKYKKNLFVTRFGTSKSKIISNIIFLLSISMLILAGIFSGRGLAYWISLFCFAIILARQEFLLSSKDTETAKKEFLQINNFVAPLLFLGTLIDVFYK